MKLNFLEKCLENCDWKGARSDNEQNLGSALQFCFVFQAGNVNEKICASVGLGIWEIPQNRLQKEVQRKKDKGQNGVLIQGNG